MSASNVFSQHPDRFKVTLHEHSSSPGGMATSTLIKTYTALLILTMASKVQVQYFITHKYAMGFSASDVGMQVSFRRGTDTEFWTNVFPSQVIDKSSVFSSLF